MALTLHWKDPGTYNVQLPNRTVAVIKQIDGKGWELSIRPGSGEIINRGLFGTPEDVLHVLISEYPE